LFSGEVHVCEALGLWVEEAEAHLADSVSPFVQAGERGVQWLNGKAISTRGPVADFTDSGDDFFL
jgi:hypothetical protein